MHVQVLNAILRLRVCVALAIDIGMMLRVDERMAIRYDWSGSAGVTRVVLCFRLQGAVVEAKAFA